ncbi:MAG: PcfJ domain-containing protein, partial [Lachnospiraceae bacterium]|nr:PcfJ domain-containing protein [Lachnospiraceae bacterium]
MNKRKLSRVKIQDYDTREIKWGIKKKVKANLVIRVQAETIDKRAVLILNFYKKEDLRNPGKDYAAPSYRLFLSKNEWEFATQDLTETKQNWTGMTLTDIGYKSFGWGSWSEPKFELDRESDLKLIRQYFRFHADPNWQSYINRFQKEVKHRRRLKKNADWISSTGRKMAEVPRELPKDFKKWIQEEALFKSRYIYYRYDKKKKGIGQQGYCTYCRSAVEVDGAKHRTPGICPKCGRQILFLCESKASHIRDRIEAEILQKCQSGLVLRHFFIYKQYDPDYRHPALQVIENRRVFLSGTQERYIYGYCDKTDDYRWFKTSFSTEAGILYTANLKELLMENGWKYSGLYEYASSRHGCPVNACMYLAKYDNEPRVEHLVKMGLTNLMDDYVSYRSYAGLNFSKESIFRVIGLSKEDTRYIQAVNGGARMVEDLKKIRATNMKFTYQQFEEARALFQDSFPEFVKALEYGSVGRVIKYLKQQADGRSGKRFENSLKDWIDYIEMGKKLNYDFRNDFVLFPADLKERHDTAAFLFREKEKKRAQAEKRKESRKISRQTLELEKRYAFETKKLKIVIPKDAEDIVREGHEMHHCVGSYIARMAAGKTVILFIRQKEDPDTPFYTMEVKDGEVVQCRGKFNR